MIYTLDTNVIIDALRQPAELVRLKQFLDWALPATVLSSVVAAELIAGARTQRARAVLDGQFLEVFVRRGRLVAPSVGAWRLAASALGAASGSATASQLGDALLAAQAREHGWSVITRDADFAVLRKAVTGLKVLQPFPERRTAR